jgi:siderophore synthetase component
MDATPAYGEYKPRNQLSKSEIIVALNKLQSLKSRIGDMSGRSNDKHQLSRLNFYITTFHRGLPYIEVLTAAESSELYKEIRDQLASLSEEASKILSSISIALDSIVHQQIKRIEEEETELIEALRTAE